MLHLLNALRAFEAASRLGSIRKAAVELRVTDGAVSRHIKHLEQELGVNLFERGNRTIRLTTQATDYATTITDAFETIRRATDQLRSTHTQSTLVIAAPGTFLLRWLVPRLHGLELLLPGVSPRLTTWNREINPADRSIDIFIGVGALPEIHGMTIARVAAETFGPVVNPQLLDGHAGDLDHLWSLPRLAGRFPSDMWQAWAGEAGIALPEQEIIWYERLFYALQAAEAGLGITIGPGPSISDALRDGRLAAPLGLVTRPGSWFLAWHSDRSGRMMNAVRHWFEEEFAA